MMAFVPIEAELARRGVRLKRAGRELVGPCPVCGGRDRFAVNVTKEIWNCRGCAKGGDVVDLVQHLDGVAFTTAVETLTGEKPRAAAKIAPKIKINGGDDDYGCRQHAKARWLWSKSRPAPGTMAEIYLRSRGITVPIPTTIRFLPPTKPEHHPAMIAAYGIPDEPEPGVLAIVTEQITAAHLTMLKADGSGKADVEKPKITIGSPAGMPIVVAPMNDLMGLAICEGIEDALSVHQTTGLGAWAAGSAPFMPKLTAAIEDLATTREYDASPDCTTIFVDDDDTGRRNAHDLAAGLAKLSVKLATAAAIADPPRWIKPHPLEHFEVLLRVAR